MFENSLITIYNRRRNVIFVLLAEFIIIIKKNTDIYQFD